jgi:hypothetical protein
MIKFTIKLMVFFLNNNLYMYVNYSSPMYVCMYAVFYVSIPM